VTKRITHRNWCVCIRWFIDWLFHSLIVYQIQWNSYSLQNTRSRIQVNQDDGGNAFLRNVGRPNHLQGNLHDITTHNRHFHRLLNFKSLIKDRRLKVYYVSRQLLLQRSRYWRKVVLCETLTVYGAAALQQNATTQSENRKKWIVHVCREWKGTEERRIGVVHMGADHVIIMTSRDIFHQTPGGHGATANSCASRFNPLKWFVSR
jgi:hypothetical protein